MLSVAAPERAGWLRPALAIVLGATALRLLLLAVDRTDLFVDETQYWFWGQHLAFGYYSKPPLIGWVIRAVTAVFCDAPFWVRFPAPIFHGATALILAAITAQAAGRRAAIWVAAGYVSLPIVAVGSVLISTDTIMFPFLALALWAWLEGLSEPLRARRDWLALAAGAALGLGFMAKYAAVYFVLGAGLAAAILPQARPGLRMAGLAILAFLVVIAPNILWNSVNYTRRH